MFSKFFGLFLILKKKKKERKEPNVFLHVSTYSFHGILDEFNIIKTNGLVKSVWPNLTSLFPTIAEWRHGILEEQNRRPKHQNINNRIPNQFNSPPYPFRFHSVVKIQTLLLHRQSRKSLGIGDLIGEETSATSHGRFIGAFNNADRFAVRGLNVENAELPERFRVVYGGFTQIRDVVFRHLLR